MRDQDFSMGSRGGLLSVSPGVSRELLSRFLSNVADECGFLLTPE